PNGLIDSAKWSNKNKLIPYVDGLLQETMRDPHHANMAFASMVNAAETALQQGLDLYAEQGARIRAAMEFQAQFLPPNNVKLPPAPPPHRPPNWAPPYTHLHRHPGTHRPTTATATPTNRPTGAEANRRAWESVTHNDIGKERMQAGE